MTCHQLSLFPPPQPDPAADAPGGARSRQTRRSTLGRLTDAPEDHRADRPPESSAAEAAPVAETAETAETAELRRRHLADRLAHLLGIERLALVLTDNRTSIISSRPSSDGAGLDVRLHWSFLDAPETVVAALGQVVGRPGAGSRAREVVRAYFAEFRERFGPGPAPPELADVVASRRGTPTRITPRGEVHDLSAIRDAVNRDYFSGSLSVDITWGQESTGAAAYRGRGPQRGRRRTRRRASLKLGSWSALDNLVRIHPLLDHPGVPGYVVASIVHHEMLHAELGVEVVDGRRRVHTPEFRRREREFADHSRARRWVRENLHRLLERRDGR